MMEIKQLLKAVRSVKHVSTSSTLSKLIEVGSYPNVLIISDNLKNASVMEAKFSNANWSANSISALSMMEQSVDIFSSYKCVVLFIDADFGKRFSKTFYEVSTRVRNFSEHMSIYLLFEGEYEPFYASWLGYVKRVFQLAGHRPILRQIISEIILQESEK